MLSTDKTPLSDKDQGVEANPDDSNDEHAASTFKMLEKSEGDIQGSILEAMKTRRSIYARDLFIFGIARRALAQSSAFRQMVEARNGLVAASLVRLQLDTVLRLYALFWVSDPDDFAHRVLKGEKIDRMKAHDGTVMKDKYLQDKLSSKNPWISSVYKNSSGFIHFSGKHILEAISQDQNEDKSRGAFNLHIGQQIETPQLAIMERSFVHFFT